VLHALWRSVAVKIGVNQPVIFACLVINSHVHDASKDMVFVVDGLNSAAQLKLLNCYFVGWAPV